MNFPLSVMDIGLWLAVMALILLITSELLFSLPQYSARILIDKKKLRLVAIGSSLGFLATVVIRVFQY